MKTKIALDLIFILICAIILFPSIFLTNFSSWSSDEYVQASEIYRNMGLLGLWQRLSGWSPRPLSDSVLFIYYRIVDNTKQLWVGKFLYILWGLLFFSLFTGFKSLFINTTDEKARKTDEGIQIERSNNIYIKFILPLLLSSVVFIYFLFIEKPSQIFYWPAGAAPYILTLAAIVLTICHLLIISNNDRISNLDALNLVFFGILAAWSSEVGAVYTILLSLGIMLLLIAFNIKFVNKLLPLPPWNKSSKIKVITAISTLLTLSFVVIFILKKNRIGTPELNSVSSSIDGNLNASFLAALKRIISETFLLNNTSFVINSTLLSLFYALFIKISLLLVIILIFFRGQLLISKYQRFIAGVLILILQINNFVMLVGVYYQFGELCCDRHLHLRSISTGLSIVLLGIIIYSKVSLMRTFIEKETVTKFAFASVLTLLLMLLWNLQGVAIISDLKNSNLIAAINNANWRENINNRKERAKYINAHPTEYVMNMVMKPGTYNYDINSVDWYPKGYMSFFGKKELVVCPTTIAVSKATIPAQKRPYIPEISFKPSSRGLTVGFIDMVNQSGQSLQTIAKNTPVTISGWAASDRNSKPADRILITTADRKIMATAEVNLSRPDVAQALKIQNTDRFGWKTTIDLSHIADERITLQAWAYDASTKEAKPLNNTYELIVKSDMEQCRI